LVSRISSSLNSLSQNSNIPSPSLFYLSFGSRRSNFSIALWFS